MKSVFNNGLNYRHFNITVLDLMVLSILSDDGVIMDNRLFYIFNNPNDNKSQLTNCDFIHDDNVRRGFISLRQALIDNEVSPYDLAGINKVGHSSYGDILIDLRKTVLYTNCYLAILVNLSGAFYYPLFNKNSKTSLGKLDFRYPLFLTPILRGIATSFFHSNCTFHCI